MKKPKKTLKELKRLEAHLAKQTSRSAKMLLRLKENDGAANPVTAGYYDRIARAHAEALADHSEIVHLIEGLALKIAEGQAAKQKAAAPEKSADTPATTAKKAPAERTPTKRTPAKRKPTAKRTPPRKAAVPRAPRKRS